MKLLYDVSEGSYNYGEIFLEIDKDDNVIINPTFPHPIKFKYSIHFIAYAISHATATMSLDDILYSMEKYENTPTCEDYFAYCFNCMRKGGSLIAWVDPYEIWRSYSQCREEYTPPKGKYFSTGYYAGVYMFLSPKEFIYVIKGKKNTFGKKVRCWTTKWMSADELISSTPNLEKHRAYLEWLENEASIGKIKPKGDSFSINQQKLKTFL